MLLEASVANYLSFAEKQVFSLMANSGKEHESLNVAEVQASHQHRVLKSALIYGANSSGKSNFLLALVAMRRLVLHSATKQRGSKLDINSFRLDTTLRSQPSEFEVQFIADGVRYQYGFTASSTHIYDEWLFAYPKGQAQQWFQRAWDEEKQEHAWKFGSNLQGEKTLWQRATRENALFLSTAVQLNSKQLQPVFDWFNDTLQFIGIDGTSPQFTAKSVQKGNKDQVLKFLKAADINLSDLSVKDVPLEESLPEGLPQKLRELILEDVNKLDISGLAIKTQRLDNAGNPVEFLFEEESDGTQKFFGLIGPWLDVLNNGLVLFVDELNNSLHTHLVGLLIQLFHNPKTNPHNAQLIFTTHDTNQLSQEIFRRDQVWFCEKNEQQATRLYPLTDFNARKNRENLELAYLSGRYGAVPFVKEII